MHKAGLDDPDCPSWQNPLIHQNSPSDQVFKEDFPTEEAFPAAINPAPPLEDASGAPPEHPSTLMLWQKKLYIRKGSGCCQEIAR